jgi:hypothetical protein
VRQNSGEMKGEKQKILEGKAALYRKFPDKEIRFYIGFPFDPTVNPEDESVTSFNKKNRNKPEYKEILDDWFLRSEKELIINDQRIRNSIENNRTLTRIYNKTAFDSKGNYLTSRYNELKNIIR